MAVTPPIHRQKNGESVFKVLCSRFKVKKLSTLKSLLMALQRNIEH